jgi:hypothetical protein
MGARTVAGAMVMLPTETLAGTGRRGAAGGTKPAPPANSGQALSLSKEEESVAPEEFAPPKPFELSQNFFTFLFYLAVQTKAPAAKRGLNSQLYPF